MFEFGISSSCFYPMPTEDAVEFLCRNRIPAIEIFFNSPSELEPLFLKRLKETLGETKVISVHPFTSVYEPYLFFSEYERRFYDGIKLYDAYFKAAATLGAKYAVLHGVFKGAKIDDETYFKRFHLIDLKAREHGVQLLQENVAPYKSASCEFIKNMKEYLGDVGFVLDTKQCVRAGEDILEMARVMGENIRHVHLSDHCEGRDCLIPGQGDYDFLPLFDELGAIGYDSAMLIEVYKENYNEHSELLDGYRHICSLSKTKR